MKKPLKKLKFLVLVLFCMALTLQNENINIQNASGDELEKTNAGWWQVGDYYTYQEINNTDVNVTYTLAEETTFNGTPVFNVTSTISQRPASIMWDETYQENHYHTVDTFDRVGSQIYTSVEAIAYLQVYNSVENVTYLEYPKLADYREGVNTWTQKSHSDQTYQLLYDYVASGPFLYEYKQTDVWTNVAVTLETVTETVPAGTYTCWKMDYSYPAGASQWPYFSFGSSEMPLTQNAMSRVNITGEGINWNPDSSSYEDSIIYSTKNRNTTRINDSYTWIDYWYDGNGTVSSGTSEEFNDYRKVVFIEKTLGLVLKSVDYYWNSGQNRWEYFYGYELRTLYLPSPPQTTTTTTTTIPTTTASTTSSTSNSATQSTSTTSTTPTPTSTTTSTTAPSASTIAPLWIPFVILLGLSFKRKRGKI